MILSFHGALNDSDNIDKVLHSPAIPNTASSYVSYGMCIEYFGAHSNTWEDILL